MSTTNIKDMKSAHKILCEFPFELKELNKGYADRILRIDLDKNEISYLPLTQEMKDLWIGGKGLDLWLMFQEINKDSKWNSPENPICFSSGPLGGTTSFPGSGKTLVTSISALTHSIMDCNVGGYFGPFLKFAGFDALVLIGKAKEESIVLIDAVKKKITIESAPLESIDSHILAEELTEMYSDNELDMRNIAVVSAGQAAQHSLMGVLNFSFWDWRRNVARLKQAGRGGVGTVFRDKKLKALVIKNRDITPAWRVEENKVAKGVKPGKVITQCQEEVPEIDSIIEKWGNDPELVIEIMQDIQDRFNLVSSTAIDRITIKTGAPKAYLYHIATFDRFFTLEEKKPTPEKEQEEPKLFVKGEPVVLRHKDVAKSWEIGQYLSSGGYATLKKVLTEKKSEDIIKEVKDSGLCGRSSGTPVAQKWESAIEAGKENEQLPYVVASAGEGDPGARINSALLEIDPHSIIEGMIIGAYGVGASQGYIIIRKEHSLAEERLAKAIEAAQSKGFLGENIQGSGFSFTIRIRRTGGAAVSGEPTAAIFAMSGRAGESQPQYIPIEEKGFHQQPTLVNHVETWANIPVILEKGAKWFKSLGTKTTAGTKVFSLSNDSLNQDIIEVPMGTTLSEVIAETGNGAGEDKKIKALLVGGPAGGFIPENLLNTKIEFSTLDEIGAAMASGSLTVLNEKDCLVGKALESVEFLGAESCGKCTPCREGLYALKNILTRISNGQGELTDIQLLEDLSHTIQKTSLCSFGINAPKSLLSTLKYFKAEYEEHINQKKCISGVCKMKA